MHQLTKGLSFIWVRFQKEGIHCYPAALTDPNLADVKFLGYDHRHIFQFKVGISVTHDDRDIEFIQFKRYLESLYEGTLVLNHKSCEMISDELADVIHAKYPGRNMFIEVSEDGENGATTHYSSYDPDQGSIYWPDDELEALNADGKPAEYSNNSWSGEYD